MARLTMPQRSLGQDAHGSRRPPVRGDGEPRNLRDLAGQQALLDVESVFGVLSFLPQAETIGGDGHLLGELGEKLEIFPIVLAAIRLRCQPQGGLHLIGRENGHQPIGACQNRRAPSEAKETNGAMTAFRRGPESAASVRPALPQSAS